MKENQGQQARTVAETGRSDGKGRERMYEWEERNWKRGRRGLEKRETGIRKEGEEEGKRERQGLEKREKKPGNG